MSKLGQSFDIWPALSLPLSYPSNPFPDSNTEVRAELPVETAAHNTRHQGYKPTKKNTGWRERVIQGPVVTLAGVKKCWICDDAGKRSGARTGHAVLLKLVLLLVIPWRPLYASLQLLFFGEWYPLVIKGFSYFRFRNNTWYPIHPILWKLALICNLAFYLKTVLVPPKEQMTKDGGKRGLGKDYLGVRETDRRRLKRKRRVKMWVRQQKWKWDQDREKKNDFKPSFWQRPATTHWFNCSDKKVTNLILLRLTHTHARALAIYLYPHSPQHLRGTVPKQRISSHFGAAAQECNDQTGPVCGHILALLTQAREGEAASARENAFDVTQRLPPTPTTHTHRSWPLVCRVRPNWGPQDGEIGHTQKDPLVLHAHIAQDSDSTFWSPPTPSRDYPDMFQSFLTFSVNENRQHTHIKYTVLALMAQVVCRWLKSPDAQFFSLNLTQTMRLLSLSTHKG